MSENIAKSPMSLPVLPTTKLQSIPEDSVTEGTPVAETEPVADVPTPPITGQQHLDGKIANLRETTGAIDTFEYDEEDEVGSTRQASRLVNKLLNDVTHVHNVAFKLSNDISQELAAAEFPDVEQLENFADRLEIVLECVVEVPNHVRSTLKSEVLSRLPGRELFGYKLDLESRLTRSHVLQRDIERRILTVQAKVEYEQDAPYDEYAALERRENRKKEANGDTAVEEQDPYDTDPDPLSAYY
ncbi:hypothetical protein TWF481_002101 [Arthrobotrys musiformis]|uniref:Uncharacterized protein n=1 Tax=Arthrobotrys musiformis TaxID=47236 RepID=A0AAV9VS69_9PEZI